MIMSTKAFGRNMVYSGCTPRARAAASANPYKYNHVRLLLLLQLSLHNAVFSAAEEDGDFPLPPISPCKYSHLRFSHIDDIFGSCDRDQQGNDGRGYDSVGVDSLLKDDRGSESIVDAYQRAAWEFTVSHGWDMAESVQKADASSAQVETDSAFLIGQKESYDDDATAPSVIKAGYPFLVCIHTDIATSGYNNIRDMLPLIGVVSSDVTVLSNRPRESCFLVSTTAVAARKVATSRPDFTVIPMTDIMKLDAGIIDDVCNNDQWAVPIANLSVRESQTPGTSKTWERKIRVALRPGLGGTVERVEDLARQMIEEIKFLAKEGNRQRRQRRASEVEQTNASQWNSISNRFSITAPKVMSAVFDRNLADDGDVSSHEKIWSRFLEEGIESDNGCLDMFETLKIEARFGNTGFDVILNPLRGQNYAMDGQSSAGSSACICSLIAALGVNPNTLEVSANRPIKLHNLQAQHLVQTGRPVAETPFHDIGLTGKGQVVSVSDTGLSLTHCYFKNNNYGIPGKIFDGHWDMTARKIVHYDNTYGDDYDAYAGHGTHVAGSVAGVVLPGSGGYDPGTGIAKDAKISFFDMAVGSQSVYDPGVARLFSSFYNDGNGAKITIGSWGRNYQSRYSPECQDLDAALHLHDDVLYVASSGNDGDRSLWRTVKNPADCKNSIAVGASQSYGSAIKGGDLGPSYMTSFSARGPTADGRTKPDVVAPGYMINSAISNPDSASNCAFSKWAGTSMAAPVLAGTAAKIRQYFVEGWYPGGFKGSGKGFEPSGSLVKAVLMNGGQHLKGIQNVPSGQILSSSEFYDNYQNMGVINLMRSLPLFRHNQISAMVVNNDEITRDAIYDFELDVTNCPRGSNQLGVTLAWYDPAPASNCLNCIVNQLDLSVVTPSGMTRYPNGLSIPDVKNNAERIRFEAAQPGKYKISVRAQNMATSSQRYSLVATGCFSYNTMQTVQKSAPSDFFLDTLWSGGLKSSGSMFGVVAKKDINITAFEFHTIVKPTDGYVFAEVYEIDGTHIGAENNRAAWKNLASNIMIQGMGSGEATRIPEGSFPKIHMKNGESKGVYITLKFREAMRYTPVKQQMGEVFSQNADLKVLVGSGNSYDGAGFGDFYPQRMFNGRIIYEKQSRPDPLLMNDIDNARQGEDITNPGQAPDLPLLQQQVSLETLWNGGIKNSGSMFGISAKNTVKIENIQFNTPYTGTIHIEAYKTDGAIQGKEMSPDKWTLIASGRVKGGGEGMPTTIPSEAFFEDFVIPRRHVVGLYVTMKYQFELRYSPVQVAAGDVFVENSDVAILVGTGNDYPFSKFYPERMFNGAIGYTRVATQSPTPAPVIADLSSPTRSTDFPSPQPSQKPTLNPTLLPTLFPTASPTAQPTDPPTSQSLSLETTWRGGVKHFGAMFDIVAKTDLSITAFVIHTPSTEFIDFEVYTISGGVEGKQEAAEEWALVATPRVIGAGDSRPTIISTANFDEEVTLLAKERLGIYITMVDLPELRYTAVNDKLVGEVFTGNLDLNILVGTGNDYGFGNFWPQRMINGAVQYERLSDVRVADTASVQAGVPFASIQWDVTETGVSSSRGWSIQDDGFRARFTVEDSYICPGGTNSMTQSGEASSIIAVSSQTPLYFDLRGMGEQFETGYEKLTFEIDGSTVATATSEALGIECSSGPVSVTNEVSSPYFLSPGRHLLRIKFTTRDGFDHVGVYYELVLGFERWWQQEEI